MRSTTNAIFNAILAAALAAATLAACDGSTTTAQPAAREAAAKASCDYYARCNQIGAGLMYATRDSCMVMTSNFWEGRWPPATCDGKIKSSELDVCIAAMGITSCDNGVDFANTVFVKCAPDAVCSG